MLRNVTNLLFLFIYEVHAFYDMALKGYDTCPFFSFAPHFPQWVGSIFPLRGSRGHSLSPPPAVTALYTDLQFVNNEEMYFHHITFK